MPDPAQRSLEAFDAAASDSNLEPNEVAAPTNRGPASRRGKDPVGPFLASKAGGNGLSYAQTRAAQLMAPARGLRMQGSSAQDLVARCAALQLLLPPQSAFVGTTAALLHGIPIPPWLVPRSMLRPADHFGTHNLEAGRELGDDLLIEVAYPPPTLRRQIDGVRHRQWRPDPLGPATVGELRVLSAARTWLDLAALVPPDFLLASGDHVVRASLATLADLDQLTRWARRRRGVRNARRILELINPAAESPPESRVRYWLQHFGLPVPEVNGQIVVQGDWLARGDLVFRDRLVVVEYDGAVHLSDHNRRYDAKRRNLLQEHGWLVVVLTANDLRMPQAMAQTVRAALERPMPTHPWR